MNWLHRVRLRALAMLLAVGLAAAAIISVLAAPVLPVIGVAVAVAAVALGSMTARLDGLHCLGCGDRLTDLPAGEHGRQCPRCGVLTLARLDMIGRDRSRAAAPESAGGAAPDAAPDAEPGPSA